MKNDKVLIIGSGGIGANAHIKSLVDSGKAEIITIEQAKEQGIVFERGSVYDYPAPPLLKFDDHFTPPLTRAERRKAQRNSQHTK